MAHRPRRTSCKCARSRDKPEVTLDDVAAVVAGLNSKVLQLRKEILELSDSSRPDGRAGCHNAEKRKSKIEARKTCPGEDKDEVVPRRRKSSSNSIRKESKCQQVEDFLEKNENTSTTSYSSEDVPRKRRTSREKSRADSFERGKPRETLIRPVKREEPSTSGRIVRARGSNEISDRVVSADAKNEATQTLAKPKRASKMADEFLVEKSMPESARKNKASGRKQSFGADDRNRKSSKEHERSGIETECAAIRHALGLSTPYCNCAPTGSTLRRVRRKRISRGVQCTEPLNLKNKRSGCLRGCFAFKCCLARTKNSESKRLGNAAGNEQQNAESSDTYKPKNKKNEKKHEEPREKVEQDSKQTNARTRRIGGGAELTESANRLERYPRRKPQAVTHVKKRLNECLIELNGIIGDVAHMFRESNERR